MFRNNRKSKAQEDVFESVDPLTLVEIHKGVRIFVSVCMTLAGLSILFVLGILIRSAVVG